MTNTPKGMATERAWLTVMGQIKNMMFMIPGIMGILMLVWTSYGQPAVKKIAKEEMKPIEKEVRKNSEHLENMKFSMAQILLIMEKTTDKKIIEEVKKETERFKPKTKTN